MQKDIHTLDAEGKTPGRIASEAALLLIGKHKASFDFHLDCGDFVQVINASKMVITGNKLEDKKYYHHTTRAHGLKIKALSDIWRTNPSEVLKRAVSRMLPKNKHRTERLKRLEISN